MSRKEFLNDKKNFPNEDLLFYFTKSLQGSADGETTIKWSVSIPEDVGFTSLGIDNHYEFLSYGTSLNVELPEDFTKYDDDEDGKLISFAQLSSWAQWLILAGNKNDLGAIDDNDLLDLSAGFILAKIEAEYTDNADLISAMIDNIFFKMLSKDKIEEVQTSFFSKYSKYCKNNILVSKLRVEITKKTGDSQFIANEFGIENFFSLEEFNDLIGDMIREKIDEGTNAGTSYKFQTLEGVEFSIERVIVDAYGDEEVISDTTVYDPAPISEYGEGTVINMLRLEGIGSKLGFLVGPDGRDKIEITAAKLNTKVGRELIDRAGKTNNNPLGTTSIPFADLKDTEVYDNPTRYETFLPYKYDTSNTIDRKQNIYPDYLKEFYDPNKPEDVWFIRGWTSLREAFGSFDLSDYPGLYDVVVGQYLKFITELEEVVRAGPLEKNIGSYFRSNAEEVHHYIMNWIIVHYENLVRYNLAKLVQDEEIDNLPSPTEALDKAKEAADSNLQGLQGDLKDEEVSDEDIQERIKLYKQCALLLNMHKLNKDFEQILIEKNLEPTDMHQYGYYNNRFYMVEDPSDELSVKNKLITPAGQMIKPFMNITNDILSALKPRLRFYKIYKDSAKKETYSFEFPFPSYTNTERAETFNGQDIDRGDGLGIKSFNFSFEGETPATSQRFIKADLTLFFQSFQDFIKERTVVKGKISSTGAEDEKFRYVDMFVNTKHCPSDPGSTSPLHYDPEFYRLRVDVGWEPRDDLAFREILINRGTSADKFNKALETMNKSFYLNLIDHEIDIADNGTVTVTANYMAFIEGLLGNRNALLSREATKLQNKAILDYQKAMKICNDEFILGEMRASVNAIRVASRKTIHQSLVEKMLLNGCLYYSQIKKRDRLSFARNDFFKKTPTLIDPNKVIKRSKQNSASTSFIPDGLKDQEKKWSYILQTYFRDPNQDNNERMVYFFMSDLVYFLLDPLYEEGQLEREEQIKIILSSMSIDIPHTSGSTNINIGQIPIEVETFTNWYQEQIIDKELDTISFMDFIKRLTTYLITDVFTEVCINEQQHKRMSFMTAPINSTKRGGYGVMQSLLVASIKKKNPIINIREPYKNGLLPLPTGVSKNVDPMQFVQYLLIYPHYRPDTHLGRGNALKDAKRGVHHLFIGADRGILKNATFSKSDIQYIREARMMSQGQNSLLQLSSLYRCDLKMIGNTIFYPGMLLYLNPFGFGGLDFGMPHERTEDPNNPKLANIMGIGGYQKIVKVSSSIDESGKFETSVECIFEHTGEAPRQITDTKSKTTKTGSTSIRSKGNEQQRIPNICSQDIDSIDGSGCSVVEDFSKDLQNQLYSLTNQGTIDDAALEDEEE